MVHLHLRRLQSFAAFAVGLVLLCGYSTAEAKPVVALFVKTEASKPSDSAKKTGAVLNWMIRDLYRKGNNRTDLLLDRGLFFSRSQALSASRWRDKAAGVAEEGYQSYLGDPAEALRFMYRAARFYEYAYTYAMNRQGSRKSLLYLGCLLYRKGRKKLGRRRLTQGILIEPNAAPPTSLNAAEQQLVQALRCQLGKTKLGTLKIKSRSAANELYVNGYLVGFGSMTLQVPPGEYYVKVTRDGYRHWGRRVRIRSGRTKRVSIYMRRSPRNRFYEGLCKSLLKSSVGEQLTDEMKKLGLTIKSGASASANKLIWVGCFKPSGGGGTGKLTWFSLDFSKSDAQAIKGEVSVPSGNSARWSALSGAIQKAGINVSSSAQAPSSFMMYPAIRTQSVCLNPDAIKLSPLLPPKQNSSGGWLASVGDVVVVYTKYGFRLEGKVSSINGDVLTMQVSEGSNPPELRSVKIHRKMVKLHWGLGKAQHKGLHVGERLVVRSVHGLNVVGVVVSSNAKALRLKTRQGVATLAWTSIQSVIKRDR
ncbi:MAG: PEGA domain-containing protein [Deltaproteobacteria bacterium]|nr:MAG: PEGA domain-containing protein [Deltaproteobacteria bacterium]